MEQEIFIVFSIAALIGIAAYFFQIAAVRSKLSRKPASAGLRERSDPSLFFPISVIKPLKGLDDSLFDNLASFCDQDYPCYEVIFSLQDIMTLHIRWRRWSRAGTRIAI